MSTPFRSGAPLIAAAFCMGAALPPCPLPGVAAAAGLVAVVLSVPASAAGYAAIGWAVASAARTPSTGRARDVGVRRGEVIIAGTVDGAPETFGAHVRFSVRERSGARVQLWARNPALPVALGDSVRVSAVVRSPRPALNPGGRDAGAMLASRGIFEEAFARGEPMRRARPSPLARVEAARRDFAARAAALLPPRQAALVTAISTGARDGLDAATNDAFARSGLAHVLSVSGLHLSVVVYGFFRVLAATLLRSEPLCARCDPARAAAFISIPAAALYAVATGASVPVIRSALATSTGFAALALRRETSPLHTIALAVAGIVACDPGSLTDPSFQLSFASVAALALFAAPLRYAVPLAAPDSLSSRRERAREWLVQSLCASAAASLGTAAIVACHFRRIPVAGVLANIAGVPLSSALTVTATVAALASSLWPALCGPALHVSGPLASALLAVNDLFANLPAAAPPIASPGALGASASCVLALAAWRLSGKLRAVVAAVAVLCVAAPGPFRAWAAARRGDVLEVVFLAVGQADCAFLRLPDGSAVLVDAGGDARSRVEPGSRDIVPFLRDAGVRRIAAVFLSHGDADHVVALPALAREFVVERVFTSGADVDLTAAAALTGAPPPLHLSAGDSWEHAGVRFEVLAPRTGGPPLDENDASLVLRVVHRRSRLLFLGDVEARGEDALVASAAPAQIHADVVKVAHHGSRTSSGAAIIAAARPRLAVISVGADNRFGFPSPEVVARWTAAGARVARTDAGAVRVVSDGESVRVTPAGAALSGVALLRERL